MKNLRIFFAAPTSAHPALPWSRVWYNNLYLPLVDMGHEVIAFDYDLTETYRHVDIHNPDHMRFIERNRPRLERELVSQIRAAHEQRPLDLFFSYFYSSCATPAAIWKIRDLGIPTMNWFCNASYQFYLIKELAPAYTWCLVPEKFRLDDYRRAGANPIYCQEAANPQIYRPYDVEPKYDVVFVGQAYGERPALVRYLLDNGIDIRVWGPWWDDYRRGKRSTIVATLSRLVKSLLAGAARPNLRSAWLPDHAVGGVLADDDMVRKYSSARINLGFSSCGNTHGGKERVLQVRLRDFEVPMCGGFYLVEYMPELEEFFCIGSEIACYTGGEQLVDQIRYFLEHEDQRRAIAARGRARCLADHTWQKRFASVFTQTGLA